MAGTFTYDPPAQTLGRVADLVFAARYDPEGSEPWTILPHVDPLSVSWHEGARPPSARLRYVFDARLVAQGYPSSIEELFPLDAQGHHVLSANDEVGIFRVDQDGNQYILFHGFCLTPQADLSADSEQVSITAVGFPHREFDTPMAGAVMRRAHDPTEPNSDIATGLPMRFNPEGYPNASPDGSSDDTPDDRDSKIEDPRAGFEGEIAYRVFLGPSPADDEVNGEDLAFWTLARAVKHIMAVANPEMEFTAWDPDSFDNLKAYVPKKANQPVDVDDDETFDKAEIDIEDVDVTGMCWPDAVERMITPHGFSFRWELFLDDEHFPVWYLVFFRIDDTSPVKQLKIQAVGEALDPLRTNVQEFHMARDGHAIANKIAVDMAPTVYECSFILAPGFRVVGGDDTTLSNFVLGDTECTGDNLDKYRLFVVDELGEGHWDVATSAWKTGKDHAADLRKALAPVPTTEEKDAAKAKGVTLEQPPYVERRRKPLSPLVTVDDDTKEPFRAKLFVSFNYGRTAPDAWAEGDKDGRKQVIPGLWDGESGTWDEVLSHSWTLLDDRIGFRVTAHDPQEFSMGNRENWASYSDATILWPALNDGVLPLVDLLVNTDGANNWNTPVFMLVCNVEADSGEKVEVSGKSGSPLKAEIVRRYDTRHRFKKTVRSRFSYMRFLAEDVFEDNDDVIDDDTEDARAMAYATMRAHQFATFAGSATIPRLTVAYRVGDSIDQVEGRDIDLTSNAGGDDGGSPIWPTVCGVEWSFEDGHRTTLHLSDRRAEYQPKVRHRPKPHFSKV